MCVSAPALISAAHFFRGAMKLLRHWATCWLGHARKRTRHRMGDAKSAIRVGVIDDAPLLAELVNYAGEGLPLYLWSRMTEPGESAWDVGRRRAAREEGSFSYRNATIIEH